MSVTLNFPYEYPLSIYIGRPWKWRRNPKAAAQSTHSKTNEKRLHGEGRGASVPLLAGGVPDLRLDGLVLDDERSRLELDPDGGLGVEAELVAGEAREQLRLAHRGVADEHHLEDVVDPLPQLPVAPAPRHLLAPSSPLSSPISQMDAILLAFSLSRILFSYPSTMPDLPRSNPARILASRAGVS